jgi:hypothetical protein
MEINIMNKIIYKGNVEELERYNKSAVPKHPII